MKAITVCVGYSDLLAITLPRNARHFEEVLVVTSPWDTKTQLVAADTRNAKITLTDAFTRYGAVFNKGLAVEEGFDRLGRHDQWICTFDADTILPEILGVPLSSRTTWLDGEILYSMPRRILENPKDWSPSFDWNRAPIYSESRRTTFPGYFHLFHTGALALKEPGLPWYDVTFKHAGGGDGFFQSRWPKEFKKMLPGSVLHLGPRDTNWFGTTEEGRAENARYRRAKGWVRGVPADPSYDERVSVPGHTAREWVHRPGT
jgi:hypothetical protein